MWFKEGSTSKANIGPVIHKPIVVILMTADDLGVENRWNW